MTIQIRETTWLNHLQAIILENEYIEVVVLPGRGAEIHRIRNKQTGLDYLYLKQGEIQNFEADVLNETVRAPEDYFFCGFYTMFPNAATPADLDGAKYEFHGDVRHVAWEYQIDGDTIHLTGHSRNMPLGIRRVLKLDSDSPRITVTDEIFNSLDTGERIPFIYGLHPYHGYPLFDEGTVIKIGDKIIQTLPDRTEKLVDLGDAAQDSSGLIEIFNPKLDTGIQFKFDPTFMKYIWVWFHFNPEINEYVGSLLPCTNTWGGGIEKALEIDTALWLEPGQSMTTSWAIEVI